MPEYNAVQTSRLEGWVKRLLGIRNGGIMPTLAPELAAAINLPMYEDIDLLAGYVPWGAASTIGAVAAQNAQVTVQNNFTSALVLLRFGVSGSVTSAFEFCTGPGLGGPAIGVTSAGFRDTRRPIGSFPLGASGLNLTANTQVLASPPAAHFRVSQVVVSANGWQYSPWFVIEPNTALVLSMPTVNAQMVWSIEGFIRQVDPDELTA